MNSYFSFKQFTIQQDKCAMKVCTDACLFGAWVANKLATENNKPSNILDIGTGTGLLSLMLAQKINTKIETIEIEEDAFTQAKQNVAASPFAKKIIQHFGDVKHTNFYSKFKCIISNPPFFENQLKSANVKRNEAMHATTLSFDALITVLRKHLTTDGTTYLLIPFFALGAIQKIIESKNLFINEVVFIKNTESQNFIRAIIVLNHKEKNKIESEIVIKNQDGNYTETFIELLKDYYLYL